jgi:hypothetical protein
MLTSKKLHKSLHEKCYQQRGEGNLQLFYFYSWTILDKHSPTC